jgi:hypothetical protein
MAGNAWEFVLPAEGVDSGCVLTESSKNRRRGVSKVAARVSKIIESPSWLTISALSRRARSTAASKLPSDETSRYASSTLVFWKASPAGTRIAMIRAETSR